MAAGAADGMLLCLFDGDGAESQIPLVDYDAGVWHGFVPGVGAGQAYGYRAAGRYDPGSGLRFNPAKLLLDPYARAFAGAVRFGPEVALYLDGSDDPDRAADGSPLIDDDFLVLVNAWWEPIAFTIPATRDGLPWQPVIDTYDPARPAADAALRAGDQRTISPRSIVVLRGPRPAGGAHTLTHNDDDRE